MPAQTLPTQRHERALCTGTQDQRYRTSITEVLRQKGLSTEIMSKVPVIQRQTFELFVYLSLMFLLLTKNLTRPRALPAELCYRLTRISGRTPDISEVAFPILARPAMSDSPDKMP